jgi:hypothetical protein
MDEVRVLSPTAILGYGFPQASFDRGLALKPHVIAVDAGSSDPGPYYLGAGVSFTGREPVKRDLRLILRGARALGVPVVVGSAGGAGAAPHLAWTAQIAREIAAEEGLDFRLALIHADIDKAVLRQALAERRISPCGPVPALSEADILASTHIVAQLGVEPIVAALERGADVVLAGRAYDPSVFAAVPVLHGFDLGLALHMGKILECAAIACEPGSGSDCMLGILRRDGFELRALNPARRCTTDSVAAHTLYEKDDPYRLPGPGGALDLTDTVFTPLGGEAVWVTGSRHLAAPYAVKLEGARRVGHRTVTIAGVRDPVFIAQADAILAAVRDRVSDNFPDLGALDYTLIFRLYGRDGVLGAIEPRRDSPGHELGVIIEVVASTSAISKAVCGFARSTLLHHGYPGRLSTAGNLAFPYSPSDLDAGEVYRFSVYHLMQVDDPCTLFPCEIEQVSGARGREAAR